MTISEALRILHCPSAYLTDEDSELAHTIPMFSKAYGQAMAVAFEALKQADALDKIRAEIEALIEWHDCPIEYDNGNDVWYCEACNQALKIIDKYRAESEESV